MIGKWIKRRLTKTKVYRLIAEEMEDLNPSPLGQVKPIVVTDDHGKNWLLVQCGPCDSLMEGAEHGGWRCSRCGYDLYPREAHAMFIELRSLTDRMLRHLEPQ